MYKAVGFLCILVGCAGWGHSLAGQEKERVRHLRALVRILGQMRSEISYGKHTMPEICLLLSELNDEYYYIFWAYLRENSWGEWYRFSESLGGGTGEMPGAAAFAGG